MTKDLAEENGEKLVDDCLRQMRRGALERSYEEHRLRADEYERLGDDRFLQELAESQKIKDEIKKLYLKTTADIKQRKETNHCENYLKILLLRYPEKFTYYFEVHEEVENAVIFPFLIQVFVENAAKHALTLEKVPLISVTVYPEDRGDEKYVNIYISDTGNGFPEETLQRLKAGEDISEHGKHIGIENCLKRFHYYYGDSGEIHFETVRSAERL